MFCHLPPVPCSSSGNTVAQEEQGQKLGWKGTVRFVVCFSPLSKDSVLSLPYYVIILMKSYIYSECRIATVSLCYCMINVVF